MRTPVLVRRVQPVRGGQPLAFGVGLGFALLAGAVLLALSGDPVVEVYHRMFDRSLGSTDALSTTMLRAVPLGLAGLAVAVAGSMGLWNIGAEGQILFGATAAAGVALVGDSWPAPVLIVAMLAAAALAGGLWALGPAVARAEIGVSEIITTLMLNEVALRLIRWLQNGPWKDPDSNNFPQVAVKPPQSQLPELFGRANIGFVIAGLVIFGFAYAVGRSAWGYELRIAGASARTATYVGISMRRKVIAVMVLSGAVAGFAGGIELTGTASRLNENISNGYGFAGIIVAALALMRPSGVAAVAMAFGAVQVGGQSIQTLGVSSAVANIIQALVLFGALAAAVWSNYETRLVERRSTGTSTVAEASL